MKLRLSESGNGKNACDSQTIAMEHGTGFANAQDLKERPDTEKLSSETAPAEHR